MYIYELPATGPDTLTMNKQLYIAKIVDAYRTANGNFFCREEGESQNEHPLDWPIFIGAEYADKIDDLPIFGIVVTDYNTAFFNGKSRPTCRTLSKNRSHLEKILEEEEKLNKIDYIKMNQNNLAEILTQYINQYIPTIDGTLSVLRVNKEHVQIPYAQFLFSMVDYFGLLFTVASTGKYDKFDKDNFIGFLKSSYFPVKDRCKASLLWFVRNGLIHQIFPKASGIGTSPANSLFFKDIKNEDNPTLNLNYFDRKLNSAIKMFIQDLTNKAKYIDNIHQKLIVEHYAFDDFKEFQKEIDRSFSGEKENIFLDCL